MRINITALNKTEDVFLKYKLQQDELSYSSELIPSDKIKIKGVNEFNKSYITDDHLRTSLFIKKDHDIQI